MGGVQDPEFLTMTAVRVQELAKRFRSVTALDGVSFTVDSGGPVALVGKNGAGKTTLLSVIAGILRPSSGSVEILDLPHTHPDLVGRVGVLMQDASFRSGIGGLEQIMYLAELGGMDRRLARSSSMQLLNELGDDGFLHLRPGVMSYGQRKRLGIAQALIGDPALVLLDEPTAGLDPIAAHAVRQLIRRRCTDAVFMISSHNLYEVQDICKRILVIDHGRVINDVDIATMARDGNRLNVTLNKSAEPGLVSVLSRIGEITDVRHDPDAPDRLYIDVATADMDRLQVEIQTLLNSNGYSVTNLARGKTLADGVLELVRNSERP